MIDIPGRVVMPGLVDAHAHASHFFSGPAPQQNWTYYANLAYGVTTAHDPSANTGTVFALSEMVKAGEMIDQAEGNIYLSLLPESLPTLRPPLDRAIERHVRVVLYSTQELDLPGGRVVVTPVSEEAHERVEGLWLILVVDGIQSDAVFLAHMDIDHRQRAHAQRLIIKRLAERLARRTGTTDQYPFTGLNFGRIMNQHMSHLLNAIIHETSLQICTITAPQTAVEP